MDTKNFQKGNVIIEENSKGDEIYFIKSGKVRVLKNIDGKIIKLAELGKNTFFGEMSMFLGSKRSATVEAVEDTTVEIGNKLTFLSTIKNNPEKAVMIISTLANRLKEAHNIIGDIEGQVSAYKLLLTPFREEKIDSV